MKQPRVVLFGGSGRLGQAFLSAFPETLHPAHGDVEIASERQVREYLQENDCTCVIHAAAVVGRREAAADRELAYRVNVLGTAGIARTCRDLSIRVIYISSAAVFDGEKGRYTETDVPSPRYFYSWTKLLGELAIASATDNHAIVRTDFFVPGAFKYSRLYTDHYCSKIPVGRLVQAVGRIASSDFRGLIHVGHERISLFDALRADHPGAVGIRITDSEMPDFPRDLSLNCGLYERRFGPL